MQVNKNQNTHMPFLLDVKLRKNSNQWYLFLFLLHPQADLYLLNKQKNISIADNPALFLSEVLIHVYNLLLFT